MHRDASPDEGGVRWLIDAAFEAANGLEQDRYLTPLHELQVDVLWSAGAYTEARAALAPFATGAVEGGYRQREATELLDALEPQP